MTLVRSSFARGWMPDADAVNGPVDGLLRADNLTLDELGTLALRKGSTLLATLADLDVHSLFTAVLGGTRYRFAGAGNAMYSNGVSLASGFTGSGDISFASYLGQVLAARGSTKKKYDGATLRTWGIGMTGGAPTVAPVAADGKTFATFDIGEAPAFTVDEDFGLGPAFVDAVDGTVNGALILVADATTHRGSITKMFAASADFTTYDGGGVGADGDLIQLWVYTVEPTDLLSVTLMIDVNASSANLFQDDYYLHNFVPGDLGPLGATDTTTLTPGLPNQGIAGARARGNRVPIGTAVPRSAFSPAKPIANAGWNHLMIRRSDMTRIGSTSGKDWTTVHAVRLVITTAGGVFGVRFDTLRIVANPLSGSYRWAYVHAFNSGSYVGLSAPSVESAATQIQAQGGTITVPADAARDSQINETWLYRMGGVMDAFYRVAVKTGVSGVGSFTISDILPDLDAMVLNIKLETDNGLPPSGVVSLAGPHYDRVFALTPTTLWPSRRINPDSFATGQAITIAGADETAYWVRKVIGGLYIGTSKDVYRLDGTGAELPDGTVDFTKTPLSIDHPPVNDAIVQDGNLLVYMAGDGWRAISGAGSVLLTGATSLLYRGRTRHGVSPVNIVNGRFRAAVSHGELVTVTPEGASSSSSPVLYRHVPARSAWFRHTYSRAWRCLYNEPDGTVLASDTAGTIWQLDTGTADGAVAIPIVLWTTIDDDNLPFSRKDPIDLRLEGETGAESGAASLHLDSSDTATVTLAVSRATFGVQAFDLAAVPAFRLAQLRLTGSFTVFRFAGFALASGPIPLPFVGRLPPTHFNDPRLKTFSGFQFRVCTVGATVTLTPYVDGIAQAALTVTTGRDEPENVTLAFTAPVTGTEVVLAADGDVELYAWSPLISVHRPLGVKAWDSGPILFGERDLIWVRQLLVKVNAGADLTMTAYLDGRAFGPFTGVVTPGVDTVVPIDLGRGGAARVGRLVLTSTLPFYPFWIDVVRRVTGRATDKQSVRYPVAFDGGQPV